MNESTFVKSIIRSDYDERSIACIQSATQKLINAGQHPVMLLGKVQSGKTKTFLGILAYAFDNGYDIAVILTKGTRALAQQTLRRLQKTFDELWDDEEVAIYDIMQVPRSIPARDRRKKLLFVVKKEDDNLKRLETLLFDTYPDLGNRKIIMVDDEADMASIGFRRSKAHGVERNTIADMIDSLRQRLVHCSFLQVTATPYALYLQPDSDQAGDGSFIAQPMRPSYTEVVPIHDAYVGGDSYFLASENENSVESYLHVAVDEREFDALRKRDGRRLKLTDVLVSDNCQAIRQAILDFLVGASILRLLQKNVGERSRRYSMVVHTEQKKETHQWQLEVVERIVECFVELASKDSMNWELNVHQAYLRLTPAFIAAEIQVPDWNVIRPYATDLIDGIRVQRVNSDEDVFALLDDNGQLRLDSALTIFIGGQILDRGVTIGGMIGFYYGRNPKSFQQDTVLQHSRMYGARPKSDLPATRFYTSNRLYQVMKKIHEFDHALRLALEHGNDQGVAFIMEERGQIRPCAPGKVLLSTLTSVTPRGRLLPVGFQTKSPSSIRSKIGSLDRKIESIVQFDGKVATLKLADAMVIAQTALDLLDIDLPECSFDRRAFEAAIEYFSNVSNNEELKGKVRVLVARDRNARRQFKESGRYNNVPFSGGDGHLATEVSKDIPCLMLLRQDGDVSEGWRDAPFWWPILQAPSNIRPVVFSGAVSKAEV